jgi:RimJ/RimL family protein N-acetyltransferase
MCRASLVTPALRTERLNLDPLTVAAAETMVEVLSDPGLYEFIGGAPPDLLALRDRYIHQVEGVSSDGRERWLNWVLRERASGSAVGYVQSTFVLRTGVADLAWVVGTAFQRRGYATEASAAVLSWLRSQSEVRRVTAHIGPRNTASITVARRLDFCPTAEVEEGEIVWEHSPSEATRVGPSPL